MEIERHLLFDGNLRGPGRIKRFNWLNSRAVN
jgi:hypothetical protein